jgi:hypothetical protein
MIDVGCGLATFAAVFIESGVSDVLAVDGPWVDTDRLHIDKKLFRSVDLEKPLEIGRGFDLAVCLEVAEHLDGSAANILIESLCSLSDVIVFSAAIPNQGGQNHINEQPLSYWQKKFLARGYDLYDIFRPRFWENAKVDFWYRQNMFLVAKSGAVTQPEILNKRIDEEVLTYVHPELLKKILHDTLARSGTFRSIGKAFLSRLTGRANGQET